MERVDFAAVLSRLRIATSATSTFAEPSCPVGQCDGSGWVVVEMPEIGAPTVRECECAQRRRMRDRLEALFASAKVPQRYRGKLLADLDPSRHPAAYRAAKAFVNEWEMVRREGRWLFLSGGFGVGKTALAYAVLQELVARGVTGLAETVPELMDDLRPGRDDRAEERLALCKSVDLLVLDDLGAQRTTEWVTERLFIILDARYREMRPTVITSNEHLEDLEGLDGWKRITDRILEAAVLVRMEGVSRRLEAARSRRRGGAVA